MQIENALVEEFSQIHSRDDLQAAAPHLKKLFQQLHEIIHNAQEFRKKHPHDQIPEITLAQNELNLRLRFQMNRIYQIEGARQLVEKLQEGSLPAL